MSVSELRTVGIILLAIVLSSPAVIQATSASAASNPTTLYYGGVVASPLQSMSDLNQINSVSQDFSGVLANLATALWIRPFYYLPSANDTFVGVAVKSYQTFPNNNTYIVHLRTDTGWSNGDPVTAWDYYASGILYSGVGAPAYDYKVIDNYTVSIHVPTNPAVGLYGLSVSSFVFGPDLAAASVLVHYSQWKPVIDDILGNYSKIQSGNSTVIQNLTSEILAYKTPSELFSGAYEVTAVSSSEIDLSKNPHYYNANNLPVDKIVFYQFTSPNAQFQYLDGGQLSVFFTYSAIGGSSDVPENYKSALPSYMQHVVPQGYAGPGLFFNNATSVVSNVHVRKAIAYALNRTELALAGGSSYSPVTLPIGMPPYMWPSMCPASCQSKLNPYGYDLTAATKEMQAAGYTQKNGAWTSKNGSTISLTLVNSQSTDPTWLAIALDLQTQLKTFGITVNLLNPANAGTYATSGTGFDMYLANWGFWVPPWDVFRDLEYLNGVPYPVMHFTGNVTVPGVGSTTAIGLEKQILNNAKNVTDEAKDAQTLSYLVNSYLPYLPLDNQGASIYVNTAQFGFPSASDGSWSAALANDIAAVFTYQEENSKLTVGSSSSSTTTTASSSPSFSSSTVTSVSTTTNTAISTTSAISTTTAISTSTATSTIVQTSTVSPAVTDNAPLIAAAVVIVIAIALVAILLARRRPSSTTPVSTTPTT